MGTLYAIGELLIDFIPAQKGVALKDVLSFERAPGGAPANVAAAVANYGGHASLITQLGNDAFGDFLLETLDNIGVATDKIFRSADANTGLAFVSLRADGERDFSFYRNPSADLLFSPEQIGPTWFEQGDILHFCSVSLVDSPMKQAHHRAISQLKAKGGLVSFDPNIRLPLWADATHCQRTVREFIPLAHLVKISDEELAFITGINDISTAIESLFIGDVQAVIYTKGKEGAELYLRTGEHYHAAGYAVSVVDTTGAGDAFIGGLLYKLLRYQATPENVSQVLQQYQQGILTFANASGALTTTRKGAISALPTLADIMNLTKG